MSCFIVRETREMAVVVDVREVDAWDVYQCIKLWVGMMIEDNGLKY